MGSACSKQNKSKRVGLFKQQKYILDIQNNISSSKKGSEVIKDLGSLCEVYENKDLWETFKEYLQGLTEGENSDGNKLTMERYCTWMELYIQLGRETNRQKTIDILDDMEQYIDRENCLKCVDSGLRRDIMANMRAVKEGRMEPDTEVCVIMFQRVLERLQELFGNFQNEMKR